MRLLFVHSDAGARASAADAGLSGWRGGAPHSIATWARGLRARGHHVALAAPDGAWLRSLESEGFPAYTLPRTERLHGLLEQATPANAWRLARIVQRERPDRLQTFQYGTHLLARGVAEALGVPWVHTILGPLSPGQAFADGPYVAVAPEFAAEATRRGARSVWLARGRLDLARFQVLPPAPTPCVGFASRLEGRLVPVAEAAARALSGLPEGVRGVIAGDGPALADLKLRFPRVEFAGHVPDLLPLLAQVQVWLGAGRTLIEGLAVGRACVSVGPSGFGGVVTPERLERVAAYNFGGRHVAGPDGAAGYPTSRRSGYESAPDLTTAVSWLLESGSERERIAASTSAWVREHLGAEAGLDALEAVYRAPVGPQRSTAALLGTLAHEKARRTLGRCEGRFAR